MIILVAQASRAVMTEKAPEAAIAGTYLGAVFLDHRYGVQIKLTFI
jgi:hypothetical protein